MKKQAALIALFLLSMTLIPAFAQRGIAEYSVYLPIVFGKPLDLQANDIIVTQAVQRDNNSVDLVAGRPALVRVFAIDGSGSSTAATVKLTVSNSGGSNTATLNRTLPSSASRASYSSTTNFTIPGSWLTTGQTTFSIVVTQQGGGSGGANSTFSEVMTVKNIPDLDLRIVPVNYTHQGNTQFFHSGADNFSAFAYDLFPVKEIDVSVRSAYPFNGDLADDFGAGDDWEVLLSNMTALKASDGAPESQFYMAAITTRSGNQQWFASGTAGIGWIGRRVSLTLDNGNPTWTGEIAAHELGHNFGRRHAPCGGAGGVDPRFPYSDGSIGTYGFDITSNLLKQPTNQWELMSYCSPQWISDYTYEGIMNDQISDGRAAVNQMDDVLLIRAALREDGVVIRPIYTLNATVSQARDVGAYQVALLDAAGETIAVHSVEMLEAIEENIHIRSIVSGVPMPSEPVAAIAILENGAVIGTRDVSNDLRDTLTASVNVEDDNISLTWNLEDVPMLLRYRADDGRYTTLTLDASGGRYVTSATGLTGGVIEVISADSSQRAEVPLP